MRNCVVLCVFLVVCGGDASSAADREKRPNVLFIAVDDMRCELGCFGTSHVKSPNIDRLASSGVLFNRAYCQQAVCNPSRVSLLTGLRPDSTKVWDLVTEMRSVMPDVVTLPQHFRQNGYRAVAYGKIFHNPFPDAASWDEPTHNAENVIGYSEANRARLAEFRTKMRVDGKSETAIEKMRGPATEIQEQPDDKNVDGKQTSDALAKLKELSAADDPFFLAVGYIRPHLPFITPQKYWNLYDRATLPLASNGFLPHNAAKLEFAAASFGGFYELRGYLDYADAPSPLERPLTEDQQRELRHGYYASVSFVDAQIGRLLAGLAELGLADNTIVVLWSDHGWKLGEHSGWCKQTLFEDDTHAPLVIRAPGAKSNGKPCPALVEFVDLYPTLCELAGLPIPKTLEGRSLVPLLADPSAPHKDAAFSQFPRRTDGHDFMGYAMRTDRYRYIEWLDAENGKVVDRELYDHHSDPAENENIAARPESASLLDQLTAKMWKTLPRPTAPFLIAGRNQTASNSTLAWTPFTDKTLPASKPAGEFQNVTFLNQNPQKVDVIWIGPDGTRKTYASLANSESFRIRTRPGAVWLINAGEKSLGFFVVKSSPGGATQAVVPN